MAPKRHFEISWPLGYHTFGRQNVNKVLLKKRTSNVRALVSILKNYLSPEKFEKSICLQNSTANPAQAKFSQSWQPLLSFNLLATTVSVMYEWVHIWVMAIRVVEFSKGEYKNRKGFASDFEKLLRTPFKMQFSKFYDFLWVLMLILRQTSF